MKRSLYKKRIEDIFNEAMENIKAGEKPNISGLMRKHGYSESSAKSLKVKETDTWQELLDNLPKNKILNNIKSIANDLSDKRVALDANKELAKLMDLYPSGKSQSQTNIYLQRLDDITDEVPQRKRVTEIEEPDVEETDNETSE